MKTMLLNALRLICVVLAIPLFLFAILGDDRDIPPDEPESDND